MADVFSSSATEMSGLEKGFPQPPSRRFVEHENNRAMAKHFLLVSLFFLLLPGFGYGQAPCELAHSGVPAEAHHLAPSHPRSGADVYRIPVIIHVVWRLPEENISDSLIEAQIAVLNANFAGLDPDSVLIRPVFAGRRAAAQLVFEVVQINRVQTDSVFTRNFPKLYWDAVKYAELGGTNPVAPEQYLNLWICDFKRFSPQGLLTQAGGGYARPPLGLPLWAGDVTIAQLRDGVVIDDNTFSLPAYTDLLTHEIGHYLGLKHTFGAGDCSYDDGMADTPPVFTFSSECQTNNNTCDTTGTADEPDMWENYLDYTHSCSAMFTLEQAGFMRAVLETYRPDLYEVVDVQAPSGAAQALRVFPNPVTEGFTISGGHPVQSATLFNTMGQPLRNWEAPQYCSLADLPGGTYWLSVRFEGIRAPAQALILKQ